MKIKYYLTGVVLFFILAGIGCGGSSSKGISYKLGTFNVRIDGTGLSVIDQYGRTILPGYNDTFVFGSGIPYVKETFGSFAITETATWIKPVSFTVISSTNNQLSIVVNMVSGNTIQNYIPGFIVISPINDNMLGISITAPSNASLSPSNRIMLNLSCNSNDHFYGLGEQFNNFDQKGNIVGIWAQDHGFLQDVPSTLNFQAALHPTYFPEPFMLTSKPAGILISSTAYSKFDLCASDPNRASIELWDRNMDIILISDVDPVHIIQDFTGIVGRQPLSPPWVIGPWISVEGGSVSLTTNADQLRANNIPSSAIWYQDWVGGQSIGNGYDLPYHWTPDFTLYPDMAGVNMTLNSMGFKALAYFNSFVDEALDQWTEATTGGYLITNSAGQTYTFAGFHGSPQSMVDLTNPAANTWVEGYMQSATTLGFSGWMADFGEYLPFDSYMQAGPATMLHNEYPVLWAKLNYKAMSTAIPSGDFVFFMRSGYLGSQQYQPVVWAGDQNTDFDPTFGLPTVIYAAINMGISGVPIFTHDIAGFASIANPPSTKELYFRWTELGCFTPVMRTHNGFDYYTNWNWNKDQDTINMFKKYATLHVLLFPYIYTYITQAHENGTPIMQALWLKYYKDPKTATIGDEYMFGDNMLVAPVIVQGATTRTLYLPAGSWYPFNGGNTVAGGVNITVDAPMDSIPVYVPAGSIIPMLTQAPDTLITGTTITVTTLADVITAQTIRVYPGADGSFKVYDGSTFTLSSSGSVLNSGQVVSLLNQDGKPLQSCSSADNGALGCGMISGSSFSVNGEVNGKTIFTLQGKPADPNTVYRIEVF
ncbi:MAG: TIM-barrel domain-containing protein [bacterium]